MRPNNDFKEALINIKAHDIQSVAARMCRVLREFPRDFTPRSVQVVVEGHVETISRTGNLFDSVWNENVGTEFCAVTGITRDLALAIVDGCRLLADFVTNYGDVYKGTHVLTTAERTKYNADLAELKTKVNPLLSLNASSERSNASYIQMGFYLDQETLSATQRKREDVYEFLKAIVFTDPLTYLYLIHPWIGLDIQFITPAFRSDAQATVLPMSKKLMELMILVTRLIADMSHRIDGLAVCKNKPPAQDAITDFNTFDPELDSAHYQLLTCTQTSAGTNMWDLRFTLEPAEEKRLVIKARTPFRLVNITAGGSTMDFGLSKTDDAATYGIFVTKDFSISADTVFILRVNTIKNATASFDANKFKVFINKKG